MKTLAAAGAAVNVLWTPAGEFLPPIVKAIGGAALAIHVSIEPIKSWIDELKARRRDRNEN